MSDICDSERGARFYPIGSPRFRQEETPVRCGSDRGGQQMVATGNVRKKVLPTPSLTVLGSPPRPMAMFA